MFSSFLEQICTLAFSVEDCLKQSWQCCQSAQVLFTGSEPCVEIQLSSAQAMAPWHKHLIFILNSAPNLLLELSQVYLQSHNVHLLITPINSLLNSPLYRALSLDVLLPSLSYRLFHFIKYLKGIKSKTLRFIKSTDKFIFMSD